MAARLLAPSMHASCKSLASPSMSGQRSCAASLAEIIGLDADLPRLVGEIVLDAGAGEDDDADRQDIEDLIVALERGGLGMACPVRLERDVVARTQVVLVIGCSTSDLDT